MNEIDLIGIIPTIINDGRLEAAKIINGNNIEFNIEKINTRLSHEYTNLLYKSDNIQAMKDLLDNGYRSGIDLIYIDPPFYSNANYTHRIEVKDEGKKKAIDTFAYSDTWGKGIKEYLEMLTVRLFLMKELLSDQGTIYIHLDYRSVHYVKIIMDCIFTRENFLNEIIWAYKSGGTSKKYFSRKHDNILVYSKSKNYIFNPQKEKSYNRDYKPYRFKNVKEYEDELGWYTLVNLKDVWQINMVGRTSRERVGYRTQKPESLLERIVLSSSREGSVVADFFGGSGTTAVVAQKNNRRWISTDLGNISTSIMRKRLADISKESYIIKNIDKFNLEERLTFDLEEKLEGESLSLRIKLTDYSIDLHDIKLKKKEAEKLKEIIKRDPLCLIDYIGIGYIIDKNVINIEFEELRRPERLTIDNEFEIDIDPTKSKEMILRIVDVFGHEYLQKLFNS